MSTKVKLLNPDISVLYTERIRFESSLMSSFSFITDLFPQTDWLKTNSLLFMIVARQLSRSSAMAGITRGTKYVICVDHHVNIRLRFS